MANQSSDPLNKTTGSAGRTRIFVGAFIILLLEAVFLVTSTVWENDAPQWACPILDERGTLLAVAAAIALLLSLLWAWNPTGPARYATLFSGVLSFAAAAYSLETDDLWLGVALIVISSPLFVVMLPNVQIPERKADLIPLMSTALFFTITIMFVMFSIRPVAEAMAITGEIDGLGDLLITAGLIGIGFTFVLVVCKLAIQVVAEVVGGWSWPARVWGWITRCWRWINRCRRWINRCWRGNRARRRRQERRGR